MRLLVRAALIAGVLVLLAAGGVYAYFDSEFQRSASDDATVIEFVVPKGSSLRKVGALLHKQGFIRSPLVWNVYNKMNPGPGAKAGRHALAKNRTLAELRQAVSENPLPEDVPLTIVEGLRLQDVDAALANAGLVTAGAYLEAANDKSRFEIPFEVPGDNLEGYLFPETYMVPKGPVDVNKLIQRQIHAFNDKFVKKHAKAIAASKRTLGEIVIMASMLEREEPKPELRSKVAGVLWKRIDNKWALGVDATSRYTLDDWNDRRKFLKKLRDESDPYNTRLRMGLPPTPIGAPSLPSLLGALQPVDSPWWYYLHDKDKNIHFAKDAAGHEANRKRYNVY